MDDCHFQYLPPRVTAPMQRASIEFRRSVARAPVFSIPLISIFLHVVSLAVHRPSVFFHCCAVPVYLSLSCFQQLRQLREDYGKAMWRDGDNGCIAYVRGRDRRGVTSVGRRKWLGWREKDVRSKGRDRSWDRKRGYVTRGMEREKSFSQFDSTQLRSCFTVSSCKFYDGGIRWSLPLSYAFAAWSVPLVPNTQARTHPSVMRVISDAQWWRRGRNEENERTFRRKQWVPDWGNAGIVFESYARRFRVIAILIHVRLRIVCGSVHRIISPIRSLASPAWYFEFENQSR